MKTIQYDVESGEDDSCMLKPAKRLYKGSDTTSAVRFTTTAASALAVHTLLLLSLVKSTF